MRQDARARAPLLIVGMAIGAASSQLQANQDVQGAASSSTVRVLTRTSEGPLMVRILGGPFLMGSTQEEVVAAAVQCEREPLAHHCDEETFANELSRHTGFLPSFWLDRTEVRVRDYERCVSAGKCAPAAYLPGAERFERPDLPVTFVRFQDANDYCRFRGARLPSEAEFERAARGVNGRMYPWGNLYNSHACNHGRLGVLPNDGSDGFAELAPVGAFPAGKTPDGVLDLAGNVAEWQSDPYRDRYQDPIPENTEGAPRVVRGGSFSSGAAWLRGSAREAAAPDTQRPDLGFRCARSAEGEGPR